MTQLEIRNKIDSNNELIERLVSPNRFILNNQIAELLDENRKLQEQCQHNFVNGYCEYCDKEEV